MSHTFQPTPRPSYSPWGPVQDATQDAPGIWFVSTSGHGGFLISPERRAAMPPVMRAFQTFAGGNAYEEDCDFAIVILAFPTEFPAAQLQVARLVVERTAGYSHNSDAERAGLLAIRDAYLQRAKISPELGAAGVAQAASADRVSP